MKRRHGTIKRVLEAWVDVTPPSAVCARVVMSDGRTVIAKAPVAPAKAEALSDVIKSGDFPFEAIALIRSSLGKKRKSPKSRRKITRHK